MFCTPLININLTSVTTALFVQPMLFVGFGPSSRYGQCYDMTQETHFKTGEFVTPLVVCNGCRHLRRAKTGGFPSLSKYARGSLTTAALANHTWSVDAFVCSHWAVEISNRLKMPVPDNQTQQWQKE